MTRCLPALAVFALVCPAGSEAQNEANFPLGVTKQVTSGEPKRGTQYTYTVVVPCKQGDRFTVKTGEVGGVRGVTEIRVIEEKYINPKKKIEFWPAAMYAKGQQFTMDKGLPGGRIAFQVLTTSPVQFNLRIEKVDE